MRLKYTNSVFILVLAFICLWGCIDDPEFSSERHNAGVPTVAKLEIPKKDITLTSVALKSEILKANGYPITERGFAWSTEADSSNILLTKFQKFDDKGVVGEYVDTIKNLFPGVSYYFWAYAKNEQGDYGFSVGVKDSTHDGKGKLRTFYVEEKRRGTSAVVGGVIDRHGEGEVKSRGVYYSISSNFSKKDSVESSLKTDSFTCTITNLKPDTWYYIRAFVKTSFAVKYEGGLDSVQTTLGFPKVDSIISWTIVKNVVTPLSQIIDEGDDEIIDRGFCWSATNPNPKKKEVCPEECDDKSSGKGGGLGNSSIVADIDNLKPNTEYYLRAYATNYYGTEYGKVAIIKTGSDVPVVKTEKPVAVSISGSIQLGGQLINEGRTDVVEQGICYSDTYFDTGEELYQNGKKEPIALSLGKEFSDYFSGFRGATTYYVCAYAINEAGIGYGLVESVTTPNIFSTAGSIFPGISPLETSAAYFMIDDNAYILGGDLGGAYTDKLYVYEKYEWLERKPFLGGLSKWQTAVEYNGSAYVLGGLDKNDNPKNDFYRYIVRPENKWEQIPATTVDAAYQRVGFSLGDAIYFIGGKEIADTVVNTVWAYNCILKSWTKKTDFEVEQCGGVGLVVNNVAYVGLGKDDDGVCNYTLWKSSNMNSWTFETTNLALKGGVLVSTVHKDKIYVVDEDFRIHVYDPVTKEWKMKSVIPDIDSGQGLHCMYSIGEFIYIGLIDKNLYKYAPLWDN